MPPITEIVPNCLCGVCLALSALTAMRLYTRFLPIVDIYANKAVRQIAGAFPMPRRIHSTAIRAALRVAMRNAGELARRLCLLLCV